MNGKGDKRRPAKITKDQYADKYEAIFGKKDKPAPAKVK